MSVRTYAFGNTPHPAPCVTVGSAEFTVVLDGEVLVEYGPVSQHLRLRPQEGCLVAQGTPHRSICEPNTTMVIVDLFSDDLAYLGAGKLDRHHLAPAILDTLERYSMGAVDVPSLLKCSKEAERGQAQMQAMEMIHSTRRLLRVKSYLEAHFCSAINMRSLAQRFGMDVDYMIREFRKSFCFTPLAYVNSLRLKHFLWTTLRQGCSQSHIRTALDSGFNDYATFCRRVRESYGSPPSQLFRPLVPPRVCPDGAVRSEGV